MKYKILSHPAELRIRIFGKTKEELFKNAAFALADILRKNAITLFRRSSKKCYTDRILLKSQGVDSLLVDFLNEILARSQIEKSIYLVSGVKINASGSMLHASCVGYPITHFDEDIKAATHQDVNIELKSGLWQTTIVLDI